MPVTRASFSLPARVVSYLIMVMIMMVLARGARSTLRRQQQCFIRPITTSSFMPRTATITPWQHSVMARGGASATSASTTTTPTRTLMSMAASPLEPHPIRSPPPPPTTFAAGSGALSDWKGDLLVLPVYQPEEGEGEATLTGEAASWDSKLDGALADLVKTVREPRVIETHPH